MKVSTIRPSYVDSFPKVLENGVLYISRRFSTAAHLCACGCGTKIVTPLRPTEYSLYENQGKVTIVPSIGNWNHPCRAHYIIQDGRIRWADQWSEAQIAQGRARDAVEKRQYFGTESRPWWMDLWRWIKNLLDSRGS